MWHTTSADRAPRPEGPMRAIARACAPFMLMLVAIVPSGHAVAAPPPVGARSPDCSQAWTIQQSPSLAIGDASLSAVTAVSSTDVWAVGAFINLLDQGSFDTLTEHWDGHAWQVVPSPNFSPVDQNFLNGVAMVSSNDVWAVGVFDIGGSGEPLILHWNGSTWSRVPGSPSGPTAALFGADAVSSNDVWAVGLNSD